jgi:hypothetical protein
MTTPNVFGFSDAARRVSDACNQAIVNGDRDQWVAFALSDGSVEGMPDRPRTYPRRRIAVHAQGHAAKDYGYIKVPWDGVTPRAAEVMVKLQRQLRDTDMQLTDPEVADYDYPTDNRREAMPGLDRRHVLTRSRQRVETRSPGGIILP